MSSVIAALSESGGPVMDIVDYSEHAIGQGSNVQAAAYVDAVVDELLNWDFAAENFARDTTWTYPA